MRQVFEQLFDPLLSVASRLVGGSRVVVLVSDVARLRPRGIPGQGRIQGGAAKRAVERYFEYLVEHGWLLKIEFAGGVQLANNLGHLLPGGDHFFFG